MDERREARYKALKLSLEYFKGTGASDTDIELKAEKFYNYITTGRLTRNRY